LLIFIRIKSWKYSAYQSITDRKYVEYQNTPVSIMLDQSYKNLRRQYSESNKINNLQKVIANHDVDAFVYLFREDGQINFCGYIRFTQDKAHNVRSNNHQNSWRHSTEFIYKVEVTKQKRKMPILANRHICDK